MKTVGYVRVSTDRQAERGVSLEAQAEKIRAMAVVQGGELLDVIVDGGESAKSLNRPGLQRLLGLVNSGKVGAIIVAKLDRLTRSVKDLCGLLELLEKPTTSSREGTKTAQALDLLRRPGGATLAELMKTLSWQAHSVRGFISGTLAKKMDLPVVSAKREDGIRVYSIAK